MIVAVQIINKIIANNDLSLIYNYGLTREHFAGYEDAFEFVTNFNKEYKNINVIMFWLSIFGHIS